MAIIDLAKSTIIVIIRTSNNIPKTDSKEMK
jgi:hypothetical protein